PAETGLVPLSRALLAGDDAHQAATCCALVLRVRSAAAFVCCANCRNSTGDCSHASLRAAEPLSDAASKSCHQSSKPSGFVGALRTTWGCDPPRPTAASPSSSSGAMPANAASA